MPTSPTLIWATLGTILLVCLINALIPAHPSLQTALTLLRTTPVHLTPSESSSIKRHLLNQHAHSTPSHFTPAPAVIPESIRLRNHLNLPPSLTPQQVTSTLHSTLHSTLSRFLTSDDDDDTLTHANTEPLKIHVNWGNMFEDTTKPYTTCFNADDWSFTGAMVSCCSALAGLVRSLTLVHVPRTPTTRPPTTSPNTPSATPPPTTCSRPTTLRAGTSALPQTCSPPHASTSSRQTSRKPSPASNRFTEFRP